MLEIKIQMLTQAAQDSEFRSQLIVDPMAAIAEKGWDVPTRTQITVVEETSSHYYLVLPPLEPSDLDTEKDLSDEQIKMNQAVQTSANSLSLTPTGHMLEIEVQLLARAAQDSEFRSHLIANPKAVMAEKGFNVPANIEVTVLQETPNHYYLVLPVLDFSELEADKELSDEELELVAGGGIDSENGQWTGCASGQSGCVATNGCQVAADIGGELLKNTFYIIQTIK